LSLVPKSEAGLTIIGTDHFDEFMTVSECILRKNVLCRDALQKKKYKFVLGISGVKETIEVLAGVVVVTRSGLQDA
jgi:hypothetical protein